MIPETPEELVQMAWDRYDREPVFHARVYKAAMAIKAEIVKTGMPWSRSFDGVITASAAAGLLMYDILDPETGEFLDFHGEAERVTSGGERLVGSESAATDLLNGHGSAESDQHQDPGSPEAP